MSEINSTDEPDSRITARIAATMTPLSSRESIASPKNIAGSASKGRVKSVNVDRSPTAVSAVVVRVPRKPARRSISYCVAPPVAAPPGSARLSALPVSCAHATSNQASVFNATRINTQIDTNASDSSTKIGTNQSGNTSASFGRSPKSSMSDGATM